LKKKWKLKAKHKWEEEKSIIFFNSQHITKLFHLHFWATLFDQLMSPSYIFNEIFQKSVEYYDNISKKN